MLMIVMIVRFLPTSGALLPISTRLSKTKHFSRTLHKIEQISIIAIHPCYPFLALSISLHYVVLIRKRRVYLLVAWVEWTLFSFFFFPLKERGGTSLLLFIFYSTSHIRP
ncbi:hypothetical protein F4810DRAFT_490836 [Camillea tinctor]|nr:hypothetical protein F4810DRAFT_490836 [Camillea tinctor]